MKPAPLLLLALWALACACSAAGGLRAPVGRSAIAHISAESWTEAHELIAMIDGAAEVGFDAVVFEARRDGTVGYPSNYEPWAERLRGVDPGWDPLEVALVRARERGLGFLVAVEVLPVWRGARPPLDPRHPWLQYPAWRWVDAAGDEQPLRVGATLSFDPCLPEVRQYLAAVCSEAALRYPVDGLVLMGARYVNDHPSVPLGRIGDPPRGERTLALFRAASGLAPEEDALAWQRWRAAQLTDLVRRIHRRVGGAERPVPIYAAILPDDGEARLQQQDWRAWLEEGLVEAVAPLDDGREDPALLRERLERWKSRAEEGVRVYAGLRLDDYGPDDAFRERLEAVRRAARGVWVLGAEPWLATGLTDQAGAAVEGRREALRRALR